MQDEYFNRNEVSNSDLTELKQLLYPRAQYGDKEKAFRFGHLFDAMITEPQRIDWYRRTVDDEVYSGEDWMLAEAMKKSLRAESHRDELLKYTLTNAQTQRIMIKHGQEFDYTGFRYTLNTRCKWDWWLPALTLGGDLKTTSAQTQKQFLESVDLFDWDRSRAWYMDIAGSREDFIYAVSKKNCKVFKLSIRRDDALYRRGLEKYEELAFKWWMLIA